MRERRRAAPNSPAPSGFINFNVNINFVGGVEFGIGDGANWQLIDSNVPTLNDGNWHQVVATYDGAMMRVYVDGVERLAVASTTVLTNPGNFYIGGRPSNTFLNGDIDERISNIARTAGEIAANFCP